VSIVACVEMTENDDEIWTDRFWDVEVHDFTERTGSVFPDGFNVETASPKDYFDLMFNPQWYKKFQLNIYYISSSLIQIIKCPDDIMKKCILTINILQFMYFAVNYFDSYSSCSVG
jgi:hypothetical protein